MKKNMFIIFAAAAATAVLASCNKTDIPAPSNEIPAPAPALFAYEAATKTTLGSDWSVSWAEKDNLSVFNVAAGGSAFSDNCKFVIDGTPADGKFIKDASETGKSLVSGESSYDWYACYPWMQYGAKPGGTKGYTVALAPQQVGYNSNHHIAGYDLMAGKALGVADGTAPAIALHHVCTLLKFTVTNNTGEPAAITGLKLDATAGSSYITGSFTMNWGDASTAPSLDASQMGGQKAYTCDLKVVKNVGTQEAPEYVATDETIANGASVDLYMVVAPFTIPAGGTIKLTISGSLGVLELEKKMSSAMSFTAGTYNTASLRYTRPEYAVFTETFAANSVTTANVPSYGKAGLNTAVAAHAADYAYSVFGNASIQASTAAANIAARYPDCGVTPAYVRLPATVNDSWMCISNITVEANTAYTFKYNKVKGGGASSTTFGWRANGSDTWNYVNETTEEGLISQDFTTGSETKIDIMVKSTKEGGAHSPYTSVDNFKLIRK